MGSNPVAFKFFCHFLFRVASFFIFIIDFVHKYIYFIFWACVYVKNTAPWIISISLHVINSLHAECFLRLKLSSADIWAALPCGATGLSAVSVCCISWSYSLFNFFENSYRNTIRIVCIQIRTDVLLVLNWVQTICKCYQLPRKEGVTEGIINTKAAKYIMKDVNIITRWRKI